MLSEKEKKVVREIDESREEIVELLRDFIGYKTISPRPQLDIDRSEHRDFTALACEILEELGFELDVWEVDPQKLENFPGSGVEPDKDLSDMPVVVGTRESSGDAKSLILNGHYDVVPAGKRKNWNHDPYGGEVVDDKVFGRGACDMKGGIVAMLKAIEFVERVGIDFDGDLTVELVPDEESGSMGTLSCCQRGYEADAAIIPEPTDMENILLAMRGNQCGSITVFGRAGHADNPQPHWRSGGAVNAITKSAKIIDCLKELEEDWRDRPDKKHRLLPSDTIVPTIIEGGDWLIKYPEEVEIEFDANFIGTENPREEIEEKVMTVAETDPWMKENPPEIEFYPWLYGAEVSEDEELVKTAKSVIRELFDTELKPTGTGSLTDAIHLINYSEIPTISVGPSHTGAHETNEYIEIEELIKTTKILALMVLRWCVFSQ
ncbi:hypothetical protein AKJ39_02385 [candidate division MSBL1 archaeon SCGC-AAA259J03]|uniref:Peptidase M20 dimerisation domain-containing protein n=1 Tax=candidate division MSBL1 archaeon SCGC-AAA259J03 TaxID=1698269 RepID=A0A656YZE3_9EURY|nr:hypothetical protein AKJ39_02385 [candidate division MSBL1 archaeon SCGC-AAA259J03]